MDSTATRDFLAARLGYDTREAGSRGLALVADAERWHLLKGDRLEPSESVPDIGCFGVLEPPFTATFWRRSEEGLTRHRNPVFSEDIGTEPGRVLTVDALHSIYLGVMRVYCRITMWALLNAGIYGANPNSEASLLALRHRLMTWYRRYDAAHRERPVTRMGDLTRGMIGTHDRPNLKSKGAETAGFFLFILDEMTTFRARVPTSTAVRLHAAGEALRTCVQGWEDQPWVLPAEKCKEHTVGGGGGDASAGVPREF